MNRLMKYVLAFAAAFLVGMAADRATLRETDAPPDATPESATRPAIALPETISSTPKHRTIRAALAEPSTFQKVFSLTALLSSTDPARFPKLWHRMETDTVASGVLLDVWQRRDLPGLARTLSALGWPRVIAILQQASDAGNALPRELRTAVEKLSLEELSRTDQGWFLKMLSRIDSVLADAVAGEASPEVQRELEQSRRQRQVDDLMQSDPRALAIDSAGAYTLRQRADAIAKLGNSNLSQAFGIAEACTPPRARSALLAALVPVWAKTDADAALRWAQQNLKGNDRNAALEEAVGRAVDSAPHPADGLAYVDMMPTRNLRRQVLDEVFDEWASALADDKADDLDAFVSAIRSYPPEDLLLNDGDIGFMWPNADLVSSAAYLVEASADVDLNHFTYYVAQRFGYKRYGPNPVAGIEWASKLTPERGEVAINTIVTEYNYQEVAPAIVRLPEGELRAHGIQLVVKGWATRDPAALVSWAIAQDDPTVTQQVKSQLESQSMVPAARAEFLQKLERRRNLPASK